MSFEIFLLESHPISDIRGDEIFLLQSHPISEGRQPNNSARTTKTRQPAASQPNKKTASQGQEEGGRGRDREGKE